MRVLVLFLLISSMLLGCSSDSVTSPEQSWKDLTFRLQTRPPTIKAGMVEFLLIGNRGERQRAHDLMVSYRMGNMGKWVQAIQDGHTGVYRRALRVSDPSTDILNVHIRYDEDEIVLVFPLNFAMIPKPQ